MDPTKNFDHLDPKLKDTYARVMGTTPQATGDPAAQPAAPTIDPTLSPTPAAFPTQAATITNPIPLSSPSLDQSFNPAIAEGPNPGTGPTINTMPTDTATMFASQQTAPVQPAADANSPTTSSFFSNPSPATSDPIQPAVDNNLSAPIIPPSEPASAPITPYSADQPASAPMAVPTEQPTQPLPSPAAVAQTAPHESSALLRVLYILAAVVFFAIYTVFWIKVFNLPFLF
jgi:hypothetical protein